MRTNSTRRPIADVIRDLEAAAVAQRDSGQPVRRFWLTHWTALGRVARLGPAVYDATVQRLWRLLASGGDGDQVQGQTVAVVVPAVAAAGVAITEGQTEQTTT